MPDRGTVHRWLLSDKHKDFRNKYAIAKDLQADFMFDELLDIADDGTNDFMLHKLSNGDEVETVNKEAINRSRLRVDTRKWYLSKVLPKKYGDKLELEHTGSILEQLK